MLLDQPEAELENPFAFHSAAIAGEMELESSDWEQILETLPVGESKDLEEKRRCFSSLQISLAVLREMWLLMDLDDSGFLTLRELARGVPTITQVSKVIYRHSIVN